MLRLRGCNKEISNPRLCNLYIYNFTQICRSADQISNRTLEFPPPSLTHYLTYDKTFLSLSDTLFLSPIAVAGGVSGRPELLTRRSQVGLRGFLLMFLY